MRSTTGKFVCQYPGLYLFTAAITRMTGVRDAYCFICVKGRRHIVTTDHDGDRHGIPSGSNTLVEHLDSGEEVYLSYCSGVGHMHQFSSFSGVLIRPDAGN